LRESREQQRSGAAGRREAMDPRDRPGFEGFFFLGRQGPGCEGRRAAGTGWYKLLRRRLAIGARNLLGDEEAESGDFDLQPTKTGEDNV
jgi:hypothetical protein